MHLVCESSRIEDYLCEQEFVDYSHPVVQEAVRHLSPFADPEIERVRKAFVFVRDAIHHSLDIHQRLAAGETPDMGYALHGLNAVYLPSAAKWVRLDARGNKPGVQAEFSTEDERLAYVVRPELDEIDYPTIYARPHPRIVKALREQTNCLHLCQYFLPDQL